ncbi:GPI-anchored CFEM domain protein ARB_01017 [Colletotrichum spaethianum]|uniref:GPI-anchored CFEM domain protein ARB_01017 n=1 Tax=Colletotrichum spaethianum TaxID=700344 RepID=A0AA37L911_9PEZI|nr:GPI-anchored CFEM domain protein ARB_01017 [Colletotrichum spaethianum]GKT40047.1 GPI-anchored CFEM domain protein ARB_01017 [Colletotrichum spaethianum]
MKFSAVAIALAGLAVAQTDLPACAQDCTNQYTSGNAIAGCSNLDIKCICSNSGFLDGIACCLTKACPPADQETAVKFAKNICTGAGVAVPDQVVCKSANASASASGSQTTPSATQTGTAASATNTSNAAATMGPVALLGGLVAALFAL